MSDFSQNGIISTLHDFGTKSTKQIEELLSFQKRKNGTYITLSLQRIKWRCITKIVSEIAQTNYLHHIIIGLDQANEKQARKAWTFLKN